jgi:hypothetical protein
MLKEGQFGMSRHGLGRASELVKRSTGDAASLCCTASDDGHEKAMIAQPQKQRLTLPAGRRLGDS